MELTIQQGDLAFGVGRALGSVSTKSPLPLLSCILLEADKSGLRVTGTDLDTVSVRDPRTGLVVTGRAVDSYFGGEIDAFLRRNAAALATATEV